MQKSVVQIWKQAFSEAEWRGATFSIRSGTFANTLKELNYNPYAGYRRVQFQKKKSAKQFQNLETSSRSPKGDENLWGNNGYCWALHFSRYREADDF